MVVDLVDELRWEVVEGGHDERLMCGVGVSWCRLRWTYMSFGRVGRLVSKHSI